MFGIVPPCCFDVQNRGCVAKQLNGKAATESFGAACDGLLSMFVRHLFNVNILKNIHNTHLVEVGQGSQGNS